MTDNIWNLQGVEPHVGLGVDFRDPDKIWSSATIVAVDGRFVTVRYNGWGDIWDEQMRFQNNPRLAKLFTYTKRVKCFVELLKKPKAKPPQHLLDALPPKATRSYSTLWPCVVNFRMPHPNEEDPKDLLKQEVKVFIQPYGRHNNLLPQSISEMITHDGIWLNKNRLRMWRQDPEMFGILPPNFREAFAMGEVDSSVPGQLPLKALEEGSLLNSAYLVKIEGGEPVHGFMYRGDFDTSILVRSRAVISVDSSDSSHSRLLTEDDTSQEGEDDKEFESIPPAKPPKLPNPFVISEPLYRDSGVRRCKKSPDFVASVNMGGNHLFLGTFPSQSQAYNAERVALGEITEEEGMLDAREGKFKDLDALTLESTIHAWERRKDGNASSRSVMSLNQWSIQKFKEVTYREHVAGGKARYEALKQARAEARRQALTTEPRKKRKQKTPVRIDLGSSSSRV